MHRIRLNGVFASLLLAACGGSSPAPQAANGAPAETSTGAAPSNPAVHTAPLPDEGSVPKVYPVQFLGKERRISERAEPEFTQALARLPQDVTIPDGGLYLWKARGTVRHGSIADALFPLDTPGKLLAYMQAKGLEPLIDRESRAWFIEDKGDAYEVRVTFEGPSFCIRSAPTIGTRLVSISREGVVQQLQTIHVEAPPPNMPCVGRDTEGSARSLRAATAPISRAAYFAQLARDEATSVGAFRRLAAELSQAGAPLELSARADAAAEDEVRHASAMRRLARAAGATEAELLASHAPGVTYPVRDLEAVLLENAREGCIHETYAALIAAHQARYAEDPEVREVFTTIAAEEQRHAELAWDLHAWASERDPRMAARLRDALEDALATLAALVEARIPRPWDAAVGEPAPARVHALVDALGDALAPLAAA